MAEIMDWMDTEISRQLLSKVEFAESGCWNRTVKPRHNGYSPITLWDHETSSYKSYNSHRIAYEEWVGPISNGLCVCHECNNKNCINPSHLYLGTVAKNSADAAKDGLYFSGNIWYETHDGVFPSGDEHWTHITPDKVSKGEERYNAMLTEEHVIEIRNKYIPYKYSRYRLAKEYNVHPSTINDVLTGRTWKHLLI